METSLPDDADEEPDPPAGADGLRESDERVRSAFDGAPVGMALTALDERFLQTLRQRDAVLEAVASSAERLLLAEDWRDVIADALRELGEAAAVSRAYLFQTNKDERGETRISQRSEWVAPGIPAQLRNPELHDRPIGDQSRSWIAALGHGQILQGHARELPASTRALLEAQGIASVILVPVMVGERWWGFLGFDECAAEREWTVAESEALRAAAGMLGAAIRRDEIERARGDAEARYRSLVETLPLTTYVDRLDGIRVSGVYVSPQLEPILGYSAEEWLSDPELFARLLHEDDRAGQLDGPWPAGDGPHRSEYRLRARDGRDVWFLDEYTIVRDDEGRPVDVQGFMVDITERKLMEEELRRTNELLHAVVQASPLGIVLTDLDDRVTFWNPAAERIYGFAAPEVLGRRPPTRPSDLELEFTHLRHASERGERVAGLETRRVCRDGSPVDVSVSLAPLHDASGKPVGMLGVHEDISERMAVAQALRESEQHFRAAFDNAHDGLAILDVERRYLEVNDAFLDLFGVERARVIGRRAGELLLGDRLREVERIWETVLEQGEAAGELDLVRTDGERRQCQYSFTSEFLPGRYFARFRDLTVERELEAQLLQSQRLEAVGRLAGGIAHDFNNLLTAVSGYAEFLLDGLAPGDRLRRDAEEIKRAGDRAAQLVRQLLAFSRRQMLRPQVVPLNGIVTDTEAMLRRLIGEDIALRTELDDSIPPVLADPAQLEQIIVNLAVNARDAMPSGGTLTIATATTDDGEGVRLTVSDTGVGMDERTRLQAFEPFFTTKEPGKGTGLGLSTVYGIVAQSGGRIELASEAGAGATFVIDLPAFAEASDLPAAPARPVDAPTGTETILVVEDEAAVRVLAERVLTASGYRVLSAAGGDEALALAGENERIDLLLADVVLPGMSGRDLAAVLSGSISGLRVLLTSGYENETDESDLHPFLGKPFSPDALRHRVREVLEARP